MGGALVRGRHDCLTCACAASEALSGRDPLASDRPAYTTFTGAMRIARKAGGWLAWADQTFTASGMRRTDEPQPGDLCLIQPGGDRDGMTFTICIRPGEFAEKAAHGVNVVPGEVMGAWAWA